MNQATTSGDHIACRSYHWTMVYNSTIQTLKRTLAGHPDLELAIVFGSVASGTERADSDVDVAVQAARPLDTQRRMQLVGDLAAATGPELEAFLEDTIVLLDPCLNPDGHGRFAQWVNSHRGQLLVADPAHREHREAWPGGRTNHYWFDLNRDWLLLTHPESRHLRRIATVYGHLAETVQLP